MATLEGDAIIHSMTDQSQVDVPAGKEIVVSPDGIFGQVSTFNQNQLSSDMTALSK